MTEQQPEQGVEQRLAALEQRVVRLEDEREITRLVTSYPPLVDSGCADEVAALWAPDGVYDVADYYMDGREQVRSMVTSDAHQGLIAGGVAHTGGPVHVSVRRDGPGDGGTGVGETAQAVQYTVLFVHREGRYFPARVGSNLWELRRGESGWETVRRTVRALDGSAEGRDLLARVAGHP